MAAPKPPDDLLATMTDPRGRTVWLTEERWKHIIEGHPEVERHLSVLKKCVETAEKRTRGNYKDTEKLWARNIGPAKWFFVVVRYEGRTGAVRTALAATKGPRQGDLI
ncbi:MAG: hypothetical protein ACLQBY_12225 [Solirubrobacteraceae bacterium]